MVSGTPCLVRGLCVPSSRSGPPRRWGSQLGVSLDLVIEISDNVREGQPTAREVTSSYLSVIINNYIKIITSMTGCVELDDFWHWNGLYLLRSFSHNFAANTFESITPLFVSTLEHLVFWMDSFDIWHKQSLAQYGVSHILVFLLQGMIRT